MTIFGVLAIVAGLAALLTLLPYPRANKKCLWGYKALCSFTPISTGILIVPAVILAILWLVT